MNDDLISRKALLEAFSGDGFLLESIVRCCIEKVPAVDAVSVVRCKDCLYRCDDLECPMFEEVFARDDFGRGEFYVIDNTEDDAFCPWGKSCHEED